jgi:polyhydroxyalkanoate synthesis regulator protein
MTRALTGDAIGLIEEQTRRNMDMFTDAMRMWMPFAPGAGGPGAAGPRPGNGTGASQGGAAEAPAAPKESERELDAMRKQLSDMQKTLDSIAGRK